MLSIRPSSVAVRSGESNQYPDRLLVDVDSVHFLTTEREASVWQLELNPEYATHSFSRSGQCFCGSLPPSGR